MKRPQLASGKAFAVAHVIFYVAVLSQHYEGSWGGFLIFIVDFPVSFLLLTPLPVSTDVAMFIMLIAGTIWWFFIGVLLAPLVQDIVTAIVTMARIAVGSDKAKH